MQLQGKKPLDDIVVMEMLSDKYGWTPSQIRNQKLYDIEAYLDIIRVKDKLIRKKSNG